MKKLNIHTPVEQHFIHDDYDVSRYEEHLVFVKREDTCVPFPGPPFSKMRGLVQRLTKLKEEGVKVIGYTESAVSMAGWGVAWCCKEMELECVIFDPQYKHVTPDLLLYHRERWKENGATIIPQKAGMVKVNYNIACNELSRMYGRKSEMLPLGLPFEETIHQTCLEAAYEREQGSPEGPYRSVVVNVGSGTIAAGVAKGFNTHSSIYGPAPPVTIFAIMGRMGDVPRKLAAIKRKGRFDVGGLFGVDLHLIDPGWEYTEKSTVDCPFPCHPYYDLKAWQWLKENWHLIRRPVLFWNIGSMPTEEK